MDLVVCSALGVDMFDCVFPTRTAVRQLHHGVHCAVLNSLTSIIQTLIRASLSSKCLGLVTSFICTLIIAMFYKIEFTCPRIW